jgi:hypothetical protein
MSLLIDGALEHGLPADYVDYLRAIPAGAETPEAEEMRPFLDNLLRRSQR